MPKRSPSLQAALCGAVLLLGPALPRVGHADTVPTIDIRARAEDLSGVAQAASEGVVSAERLAMVPLLRPAEVLEMVPGLLVTQHAGDDFQLDLAFDHRHEQEARHALQEEHRHEHDADA